MDVAFRDSSHWEHQSRQSHVEDTKNGTCRSRGTSHDRPGSGQSGPPLPDSELLVHENASLLSLVEHQQHCISALRRRVSVAEREQKSLKDEVKILKEALAASDDEIVAMSAQVDEVEKGLAEQEQLQLVLSSPLIDLSVPSFRPRADLFSPSHSSSRFPSIPVSPSFHGVIRHKVWDGNNAGNAESSIGKRSPDQIRSASSLQNMPSTVTKDLMASFSTVDGGNHQFPAPHKQQLQEQWQHTQTLQLPTASIFDDLSSIPDSLEPSRIQGSPVNSSSTHVSQGKAGSSSSSTSNCGAAEQQSLNTTPQAGVRKSSSGSSVMCQTCRYVEKVSLHSPAATSASSAKCSCSSCGSAWVGGSEQRPPCSQACLIIHQGSGSQTTDCKDKRQQSCSCPHSPDGHVSTSHVSTGRVSGQICRAAPSCQCVRCVRVNENVNENEMTKGSGSSIAKEAGASQGMGKDGMYLSALQSMIVEQQKMLTALVGQAVVGKAERQVNPKPAARQVVHLREQQQEQEQQEQEVEQQKQQMNKHLLPQRRQQQEQQQQLEDEEGRTGKTHTAAWTTPPHNSNPRTNPVNHPDTTSNKGSRATAAFNLPAARRAEISSSSTQSGEARLFGVSSSTMLVGAATGVTAVSVACAVAFLWARRK